MPRCSVVIRACNEEKHIGRLLSGLLRQTERDLDILLVDSGSSDATLAIASRYPVRIIHLPKSEFTFGRSLNLGLQHATGDYVVVASAHVYPLYTDWLARLLAPFDDPRIALVYGCQRGNDATRYSEQRVFEKWFPSRSVTIQNHPFCNNANAAIRRSVWQTLPYDESLTGLEDLDWATRVLALGHAVSYEAEALVVHVHEETPTRIYNRYRREAFALRRILPGEHFHLGDFVRLYVGNVVSDCVQARHERRLRRELPEILMFRLMQFWGTYRGFAQRSPMTSALKEKFFYPKASIRPVSEQIRDGQIDYSEADNEWPGTSR